MKFKSIRCNNKNPTPYLKKHICELNLLPNSNIIDLGCGSGRNSNFLKVLGFSVFSFDKKSDYGIALDLGHDKMPNDIPTPDLILCNYLFCFMKANERKHLAEEINKVARPGCFLMVELYSGKKTYPYTTIEIKKMFPKHQWKTRHLIKDRFILRRTSDDL